MPKQCNPVQPRIGYTNQGHSLLGYRCVTMEGQPHDKTLAGERGEIWQCTDTLCRAHIVDPRKNSKLITFENAQLGKWILRLKVPSNPEKQVQLANRVRQCPK